MNINQKARERIEDFKREHLKTDVYEFIKECVRKWDMRKKYLAYERRIRQKK